MYVGKSQILGDYIKIYLHLKRLFGDRSDELLITSKFGPFKFSVSAAGIKI